MSETGSEYDLITTANDGRFECFTLLRGTTVTEGSPSHRQRASLMSPAALLHGLRFRAVRGYWYAFALSKIVGRIALWEWQTAAQDHQDKETSHLNCAYNSFNLEQSAGKNLGERENPVKKHKKRHRSSGRETWIGNVARVGLVDELTAMKNAGSVLHIYASILPSAMQHGRKEGLVQLGRGPEVRISAQKSRINHQEINRERFYFFRVVLHGCDLEPFRALTNERKRLVLINHSEGISPKLNGSWVASKRIISRSSTPELSLCGIHDEMAHPTPTSNPNKNRSSWMDHVRERGGI
ncbi:hypothetical protein M408DRAFT_312510 [Serendipita vermifera MAFF 305830]|uniref:Uncharacterized protein n=1 Tax=Serendipita vermifera MAFF 305830 TaxID=933852 RepID=A0A0C3AI27_SERVB|nr:hypothetical protein M408DRAFT_312510 [Serendipita vermifera MAFF 305830]